jgi:hypothetical protein
MLCCVFTDARPDVDCSVLPAYQNGIGFLPGVPCNVYYMVSDGPALQMIGTDQGIFLIS